MSVYGFRCGNSTRWNDILCTAYDCALSGFEPGPVKAGTPLYGWSFAIILILETILYLYFFHIGIFKMEWLSFKKMLLTYWPPLLLATFIISQPYFYQNLFVAGMEGMYISFLHTTCMSVTMVFITKGEFLDYCVLYLFAYSLVYVISAPLLLKFFRDLFF